MGRLDLGKMPAVDLVVFANLTREGDVGLEAHDIREPRAHQLKLRREILEHPVDLGDNIDAPRAVTREPQIWEYACHRPDMDEVAHPRSVREMSDRPHQAIGKNNLFLRHLPARMATPAVNQTTSSVDTPRTSIS